MELVDAMIRLEDVVHRGVVVGAVKRVVPDEEIDQTAYCANTLNWSTDSFGCSFSMNMSSFKSVTSVRVTPRLYSCARQVNESVKSAHSINDRVGTIAKVRRALDHGLEIAGRRYLFLAASASQAT